MKASQLSAIAGLAVMLGVSPSAAADLSSAKALYASASYWQPLHRERPELRRLRVWEADYPGRFTRWFPRLAAMRVRLRHGVTVVMWQWTDRYQLGGRGFDASRLLAPLESLLIEGEPVVAGGGAKPV